MLGSVVITGKYGPGLTATASTFSNLRSLEFDFMHNTINMIDDQGKFKSFELTDTATISVTLVAGISMVSTIST